MILNINIYHAPAHLSRPSCDRGWAYRVILPAEKYWTVPNDGSMVEILRTLFVRALVKIATRLEVHSTVGECIERKLERARRSSGRDFVGSLNFFRYPVSRVTLKSLKAQ